MTIKDCATKGTDFILYCTSEELCYISDGLAMVTDLHNESLLEGEVYRTESGKDLWLTEDEVATCEEMHTETQNTINT